MVYIDTSKKKIYKNKNIINTVKSTTQQQSKTVIYKKLSQNLDKQTWKVKPNMKLHPTTDLPPYPSTRDDPPIWSIDST